MLVSNGKRLPEDLSGEFGNVSKQKETGIDLQIGSKVVVRGERASGIASMLYGIITDLGTENTLAVIQLSGGKYVSRERGEICLFHTTLKKWKELYAISEVTSVKKTKRKRTDYQPVFDYGFS